MLIKLGRPYGAPMFTLEINWTVLLPGGTNRLPTPAGRAEYEFVDTGQMGHVRLELLHLAGQFGVQF